MTDPVSPRMAIQGEEGSNSAAAARLLLGAGVRLSFCSSFRQVFSEIDQGRVEGAVLPVENTTAGLVQEVWDRLLGITGEEPLSARAEARMRIAFVAACRPGARARVKRILAHPVAAAQCGRFLASSGLEVSPCHDTAGAARLVAEGCDDAVAALCPPGAVEAYGLEVFAPECGDSARTVTRFLRIEPGEARPGPDDDRAVLSLVLPDRPGALVPALTAFSSRGLNLCGLHSRAIPGRPGAYAFLVEVEAGGGSAALSSALAELSSQGAGLRLLGSFRAPPWPELPPSSPE